MTENTACTRSVGPGQRRSIGYATDQADQGGFHMSVHTGRSPTDKYPYL